MALLSEKQMAPLVVSIHGHAENLMEGGGEGVLTRWYFPDFNSWTIFRDTGKLDWNLAKEIGRRALIHALENEWEAIGESGLLEEPVRTEFFDETSIDSDELEDLGWPRYISPSELMEIVKKLKLD